MSTGVRGYLDYADQKIADEQKRAKEYLSTSSEADTAVNLFNFFSSFSSS